MKKWLKGMLIVAVLLVSGFLGTAGGGKANAAYDDMGWKRENGGWYYYSYGGVRLGNAYGTSNIEGKAYLLRDGRRLIIDGSIFLLGEQWRPERRQ